MTASAVPGDILQFISGTENEDPGHVNTLVTLAKELLDLEVKVCLERLLSSMQGCDSHFPAFCPPGAKVM